MYKNMDKSSKPTLSDELIAAFVDGRTTPEETQLVLHAMLTDENIRDMVEFISRDYALDDEENEVDDEEIILNNSLTPVSDRVISFTSSKLPMAKMAAKGSENLCGVRCEEFIMDKRNVPFDDQELVRIAKENKWLRKEGVPLFFIGELIIHFPCNCGIILNIITSVSIVGFHRA